MSMVDFNTVNELLKQEKQWGGLLLSLWSRWVERTVETTTTFENVRVSWVNHRDRNCYQHQWRLKFNVVFLGHGRYPVAFSKLSMQDVPLGEEEVWNLQSRRGARGEVQKKWNKYGNTKYRNKSQKEPLNEPSPLFIEREAPHFTVNSYRTLLHERNRIVPLYALTNN